MKTVMVNCHKEITTLIFYNIEIKNVEEVNCTPWYSPEIYRHILPTKIVIESSNKFIIMYNLCTLKEAEDEIRGKKIISQVFYDYDGCKIKNITEEVYKYIEEKNLSTNYADWSKKDLAKFKLRF